MSDCIFCKIINGEIPASKVYEDEHVLAFLDISQITKGHTLVIPKAHYENLFDLPQESAEKLFSVVPKIVNAMKSQLHIEDLNLVSNSGRKAGQEVFHLHLHLIPRYGKGDGYGAVWKSNANNYTREDLQNLAETIASGIV
ncbi:HIT family protein [Calidifontibacillus erzurumensis]|uniref:HIT family protein n=1 Tax=Calidifontibacillus erzurumensis TaxID=2741433 RepID=A0A8J8GEF8_9BACI|nr:HIT family protein [Calidifontibacillus erzurumensis]NSL52004.1 HIT family protein [Calidifontibacillus erzurumensis]